MVPVAMGLSDRERDRSVHHYTGGRQVCTSKCIPCIAFSSCAVLGSLCCTAA